MTTSPSRILALLLSSAAITARPPRVAAQDVVDATGRYAAVAREVATLIEHERRTKGIPAISVSIVDGQRIIWAQGFGWADSVGGVRADASTIYRVGSVSKLFTDIAIMRLVEKGALSLDAPIQTYLPDFHPANPFGGDITIRQLTSHRAGLTREPPVGNYFDDTSPSLAATVASLNSTTLVYKPGTHAKYSNAGIAVLGSVLESGKQMLALRAQHDRQHDSLHSFYPYLEHDVLEPMGLTNSAFRPLPRLQARLAKADMWTLDGRRFPAPTFQLGMGPCGSMYTTVLDLGKFLQVLFAGGMAPSGQRILTRATLDTMWTPQFAPAAAKAGYGIGFGIGEMDGHRTIGHDGAIYGFATTLAALPDDSIGVVVTATLDGVNAVTDHIARTALRLMLDTRANRPLATLDTTIAPSRERALAAVGRYTSANNSEDLEEFEGRLLRIPGRGGFRGELRTATTERAGPVLGPALRARAGARATAGDELIVDDRLAFGETATLLPDALIMGRDTLRRVAARKPAPPSAEFASIIGEYGWDHNVLYIREKDGKLNALIEWFFEYPLERVSRDIYRFPNYGLYDGQQIEFKRGADGRATTAIAATVAFKRRPLPGDNDAINTRITPVASPAALRKTALAATPPKESGTLKKPDLVELKTLDSTIKYDIRYATSNNFMGTPFYTSAHAFMQRPAAQAVARASAELKKLGYGLLIHDSYRPWYVTKMFWDGTPPDKHIFVADPSQGSRHNRGCAVDLTLYDLATGKPINMTGGYDEMTDRSYPLYPGGTSLQRWSRDLLRHAMEAQGFTVYEAEWWHFDYADWPSYPIGNLTFEQLARTGTAQLRP